MVDPQNIANPSSETSNLRHIAQRRTLADRRRSQLVALLYRHGDGMRLTDLLNNADSPLVAEAIIYRNPDWFVVGRCCVRLAWVEPQAIANNRARMSRRAGGAA